MNENYAVEMTGITKRFPGIVANDGVNLAVRNNEVLALLGENGAGKSTLMSILFGVYNADEGVIKIRGKTAAITNPNDATVLGVGMVHQHFKLVHNYTVTENIVLGLEPVTKQGILDLASAEKRVAELSKRYGLDVAPDAKIEDITVGMQQRVEILKVLYRNADIIIFDEPTAVLTPQEIDELLDIIRGLKAEGKTIILITHKLREIKAVADRCTVLRRGKTIGTVDVASATESDLVEMMVGRVVDLNIEKKPVKPGPAILSVQDITVKNSRGLVAVHNLSLEVHSGEILGVAGVDGNGQSELLDAITGMTVVESGKIILNGEDITPLSIRKRIERKLLNVPEDRQQHGIVGAFTIGENAVLKNYYKPAFTAHNFLLNYPVMNKTGENFIKEYDIRAGKGALTEAGSMSGGNQQKLIIAREISLAPELLIVAQPTRGLDVGAIEYIRKRIVAERDKGRAVLLVSFELDEVMSLCDRIAAISKGSIVGIKKAGEVTEREIGAMMAGRPAAA
ncbi:MAG: ABC transporter ATP-binding protein [Spirochaetaceae bacterium]|jgi:simple sugar transport system ATP-binding protein|nr:ABC transporter ATP-binding protein [Spirochaetaceae bacterium]